MPSPEKDAKKFLSSSMSRVDRDEIKRLLKPDDGNKSTASAINRIDEKRRAEIEKRKAHQQAIYSMDLGALDTTFHLPGKPDPRSTLPADFSRRSPRKQAKLTSSQSPAEQGGDDTVEAIDFLPAMLGLDITGSTSPKNGTMLQSPGRDNRPLSDIDQISAIMEGIRTGDEAINFFARYGSDTPVILERVF